MPDYPKLPKNWKRKKKRYKKVPVRAAPQLRSSLDGAAGKSASYVRFVSGGSPEQGKRR